MATEEKSERQGLSDAASNFTYLERDCSSRQFGSGTLAFVEVLRLTPYAFGTVTRSPWIQIGLISHVDILKSGVHGPQIAIQMERPSRA